jgi:hypothetical protein
MRLGGVLIVSVWALTAETSSRAEKKEVRILGTIGGKRVR